MHLIATRDRIIALSWQQVSLDGNSLMGLHDVGTLLTMDKTKYTRQKSARVGYALSGCTWSIPRILPPHRLSPAYHLQ